MGRGEGVEQREFGEENVVVQGIRRFRKIVILTCTSSPEGRQLATKLTKLRRLDVVDQCCSFTMVLQKLVVNQPLTYLLRIWNRVGNPLGLILVSKLSMRKATKEGPRTLFT